MKLAWTILAVFAALACGQERDDGRSAPRPAPGLPEASPPAQAAPATPPASAPALDPAIFARDQQTNSGLVRWGETIVVRGERQLQAIDLRTARAAPVRIDGADVVIDVASSDVRLALARAANGVFLAEERGGSFRPSEVPAELRQNSNPTVRLAADATTVAIIGMDVLYVRRSGAWSRFAIPRGFAPPGIPAHTLIAAGRLYAGYAAGEWGGALVSFDLANGRGTVVQTQPPRDLALPVTGLARARDGRIWVARGLAHLGLRTGRLGYLQNGAWNDVAHVERHPDRAEHWNLGPGASFDAMALDANDRVHVATGAHGVARLDGASWNRLTARWPEFVYLSGLLVAGDTLVIAAYDAGVMLWDVRTGAARRVALVP